MSCDRSNPVAASSSTRHRAAHVIGTLTARPSIINNARSTCRAVCLCTASRRWLNSAHRTFRNDGRLTLDMKQHQQRRPHDGNGTLDIVGSTSFNATRVRQAAVVLGSDATLTLQQNGADDIVRHHLAVLTAADATVT